MAKTREYNKVVKGTDVCPAGELLTDKELERMKLHNRPRDWPTTKKVKVKAKDVYFSFGGRNSDRLWGKTEKDHINKMLELYDELIVKPEWMTRELIYEYAREMGVKL